jgi:hypothetical protein
MSKIEHEKSCSYINLMYPTNPPQPVPCNCRLSRLVDEEELRGQIAKEIEDYMFTYSGTPCGLLTKHLVVIAKGGKVSIAKGQK